VKRTSSPVVLAVSIGILAADVKFRAAAVQLISVTASFRCASATTPNRALNPPSPCLNGDRIAGDNLGTYTGRPTGPKSPPQNAYITSDGEFWFAWNGSGRSIFLDFSDVLAVPQPQLRQFTTVWGTDLQPNTLALPIGVSNGMWGLTLNQPADAWLKLDFEDANDPYRWTVRFDATRYPPSTYLTMTCTRLGAGICTAWTIEAAAAHRARLVASTTSGKYVTYDEGLYSMPFEITVTYP
jgi:hypothetical protein